MCVTHSGYITLLTSLTSPTSKFLVSGPAPLPSAAGPLTGVHGVEIVPAVNTLPPEKKKKTGIMFKYKLFTQKRNNKFIIKNQIVILILSSSFDAIYTKVDDFCITLTSLQYFFHNNKLTG